jgi:hypothetical protein
MRRAHALIGESQGVRFIDDAPDAKAYIVPTRLLLVTASLDGFDYALARFGCHEP